MSTFISCLHTLNLFYWNWKRSIKKSITQFSFCGHHIWCYMYVYVCYLNLTFAHTNTWWLAEEGSIRWNESKSIKIRINIKIDFISDGLLISYSFAFLFGVTNDFFYERRLILWSFLIHPIAFELEVRGIFALVKLLPPALQIQ